MQGISPASCASAPTNSHRNSEHPANARLHRRRLLRWRGRRLARHRGRSRKTRRHRDQPRPRSDRDARREPPQDEALQPQRLAGRSRRDAAKHPIQLAWFSPDCTHHSKAKGSAPIRSPSARSSRDLAWIVVLRAQRAQPRIIMLENVEEFAHWAPLLENGRPCPNSRGLTFRRWVRELRKAGYTVEWRELRACDYGAPTVRKRLFVIARRDGEPIVWPTATHGPGLDPYRTAADCVDWTIPTPSIFLSTTEARAIGCKRPLAEPKRLQPLRRCPPSIQNPSSRSILQGASPSKTVRPKTEPRETMGPG